MANDPKGWPNEKRQILRNHRNILIGWIMFMLLGWFANWGQTTNTKEPDKYQHIEQSASWDPSNYVDPYKQYKETHKIR